ncbi:hypothetical protein P24_07469 [Oceanibaculum indicum P24]|uniref:EamA domain-containing protein n=2 Tax=Oceanibaculum indicum TaxID=526216 RepID=K2KGK2_9PROT|nr:hypothetical protein P24_07469 [Oceanibaculum indicum P24]
MMVCSCALIAATSLMAKALGPLGSAALGIEGTPLHPMQVSAGRFGFAFLALLLILTVWRPRFHGIQWGTHAARSTVGWAGVSCMFAAAAHMNLADAMAISFLSPIFTMMLAIPFLGEKVGRWRWLAAAIALVGGMLIVRPGTDAFQIVALVALSAALLMGAEAILIKRLTSREPPFQILVVNNGIGAAIALTAVLFVWLPPTPAHWGVMALIGVTMLCAQTFFLQAMRRAEASYVIPFYYATLIFATFYDFVVFGDLPAWISVAGSALIVSGALLQVWREKLARERKAAAA